MYRSLVRRSFRERKRGKNEQWGEIKCHVNLCMVDIFYLKATRKKLQITQWSYGALQNNARSWEMANWEGFLTACVSTKEKKQDHSAHPLEVDQKGWPCWVPCEASYVLLLQGDIAFHSSLTCLICLDWISARRTKGKCEPNQFIWEEKKLKVRVIQISAVEVEGKMNNHYYLVFFVVLWILQMVSQLVIKDLDEGVACSWECCRLKGITVSLPITSTAFMIFFCIN